MRVLGAISLFGVLLLVGLIARAAVTPGSFSVRRGRRYVASFGLPEGRESLTQDELVAFEAIMPEGAAAIQAEEQRIEGDPFRVVMVNFVAPKNAELEAVETPIGRFEPLTLTEVR